MKLAANASFANNPGMKSYFGNLASRSEHPAKAGPSPCSLNATHTQVRALNRGVPDVDTARQGFHPRAPLALQQHGRRRPLAPQRSARLPRMGNPPRRLNTRCHPNATVAFTKCPPRTLQCSRRGRLLIRRVSSARRNPVGRGRRVICARDKLVGRARGRQPLAEAWCCHLLAWSVSWPRPQVTRRRSLQSVDAIQELHDDALEVSAPHRQLVYSRSLQDRDSSDRKHFPASLCVATTDPA